jgi:hypothetical protein
MSNWRDGCPFRQLGRRYFGSVFVSVNSSLTHIDSRRSLLMRTLDDWLLYVRSAALQFMTYSCKRPLSWALAHHLYFFNSLKP